MKKLLLILLLFPMAALAQQDYPRDITLNWTNADQYEDGTAIDAGDLTEVRVECFRNNDLDPTFTATVPVTGEGAAQSEVFTGVILNPGTYSCVAFSIIFDGTESVASAPVFKKYTGKPKSPVIIEFT
jgi:hypothetical protein